MSRTTNSIVTTTSTSIDRDLHSPSKLPSYRFIDARLPSIAKQAGFESQHPSASANRNATSRQVSSGTRKSQGLPFIYDSKLPSLPSLAPCIKSSTSRNPASSLMSNGNTRNWVEEQSIAIPSAHASHPPPSAPRRVVSLTIDDKKVSSPKISPIRQFKPSRNSTGSTRMAPSRRESDEDTTIRALDGFDPDRTPRDLDEQNSDDSDLFLNMAREEEASRPKDNAGDGSVAPTRRSRLSLSTNRMSMPPSISYQASPRMARRGSEHESTSASKMEGQALTYRPSIGNRGIAGEDYTKSRIGGLRSMPTTPRGTGDRSFRETSPESQITHAGRSSIPDPSQLSRPRSNSYRQSNLSYSNARNYNSSPLVSRSMESNDAPENHPVVEGTESTISTTAASTVWDELEELKSRIHRLELTGKLPATSGAAVSHASANRPPTATTTVTTISSSPKRGRGNSISPSEIPGTGAATAPPAGDNHPLLQAALAKSRTLLDPEVYKALEATTTDALAIASMMGTSGQPGPISSSQSTIGVSSGVTDRQVRRKADSLCRSLTELCLAMSEAKNEPQPANNQIVVRPSTGEEEVMESIETSPTQTRSPASNDPIRIKASPRGLSRLEARRSSMLSTNLPSPRYAPSEVGTPTQSTMGGRRTSLYLRSRRAGTEEAEEDETRYRTPSRAVTEGPRPRNSPREYTSTQPLPEIRSPTAQSSLPVRRHYASTSMPQSGLPTPQASAPRRFFDRTTPERTTSGVVSRLAEDRGQRKSSIGGFGLSGLARRARQNSVNLEQSSSNQDGYR
ncbi:hypothetical protein BP5796_04901 [Coleophoma crateriformis]|uniref:Uncharacterized protein n=1 Tax=Coleophoma crateriformis TaxID=565419 RepID=A0A3D8SAV2_9HELO|nr:hypothetical protein BP5796_04901 [Coleophoma crateriformis]